jgi:hypothetical protein
MARLQVRRAAAFATHIGLCRRGLSSTVLHSLRNLPAGVRTRGASTCSYSSPPSMLSNTSALRDVSVRQWFARALVSVARFDAVPTKEPDWGDDDDDEEEKKDEDDDVEKESGDGGGRSANGGTGGGGGRGDDGGNNDDDRGFLARLIAFWTSTVTKRPVLTTALSTMMISVAGDYCAQRLAAAGSKEEFSLDQRRCLSIGVWGFIFMGPVLHHWYGLLDRLFVGKYAVLLKLFSDQLAFAPFFNASFIIGTSCLEGGTLSSAIESVKSSIWPSMKANWTVRCSHSHPLLAFCHQIR